MGFEISAFLSSFLAARWVCTLFRCAKRHCLSHAGPEPAWDTRGGEKFSERGSNFLNYVQ